MQNSIEIKSVNRIIDANLNRLKEGLRVCEEITRFLLDDRSLTSELKITRHRIDQLANRMAELFLRLKSRDSLTDVGKTVYANELKRTTSVDIFFANIQRAKESIRVLEELAKLKNSRLAIEFKKLRYSVYEIEKKAALRLEDLS